MVKATIMSKFMQKSTCPIVASCADYHKIPCGDFRSVGRGIISPSPCDITIKTWVLRQCITIYQIITSMKIFYDENVNPYAFQVFPYIHVISKTYAPITIIRIVWSSIRTSINTHRKI